MNEMVMHFLVGCAVSFAGSIPLGTVNLIVIRAAVDRGFKPAMLLALGAVVVEAVYAYFSVMGVFELVKLTSVEYYVAVVSIPVFLALGIYFLTAKQKKEKEQQEATQKSFAKGLVAGMLNPLCIPFWMTWSLWLHTNGYLYKTPVAVYTYLAGISSGTLVLLAIYAKLGHRAGTYLKEKAIVLNRGLGILFLAMSLWQLYKFYQMTWV